MEDMLTRLSVVVGMATTISEGILMALCKITAVAEAAATEEPCASCGSGEALVRVIDRYWLCSSCHRLIAEEDVEDMENLFEHDPEANSDSRLAG